MLRFVSSLESLTQDVEVAATAASAWVQVIPTGAVKPESNAGAMVLESFSGLKKDLTKLEHKLQAEAKTREESDIVLAQYIAKINNLLVENNILKPVPLSRPGWSHLLPQETNKIHDANSVLYNCIVCMDRQRTISFEPCGHMATCLSCSEEIMTEHGSICPLCRTRVTKAQRTFLS